MARLNKADIERKVQRGEAITWTDNAGKSFGLALKTPAARRLFCYLLASKTREPTNLDTTFIDGLWTAFSGQDDPAATVKDIAQNKTVPDCWKLRSVTTGGFGGLNTWGGPPFHHAFDEQSALIEGSNGSGKSWHIGCIVWALTGERPRDQAEAQPHQAQQVFGADDKPLGMWPPIACYPPSVAELAVAPRVHVRLTFATESGKVAIVERELRGSAVTLHIDPAFDVPAILIETGLAMPARLSRIRLNEGGGRLSEAVQKLTGLDDLTSISKLAEGLCHAGREYLSYNKRELADSKKRFAEGLAQARTVLATVQLSVPEFTVADTSKSDGALAMLGKDLVNRAGELARVVSNDLSAGLDLGNLQTQHQIIRAIGLAQQALDDGLPASPHWNILQTIAAVADGDVSALESAIQTAKREAVEALRLVESCSADSKFQLKAVAARWHAEHRKGPIESCPLCDTPLGAGDLTSQLEALRQRGDLAVRTFDDNLRAIGAALEAAIPDSLKSYRSVVLDLDPRAQVISEVRAALIEKGQHSKYLQRYVRKVNECLLVAPREQGPPSTKGEDSPALAAVFGIVNRARRIADLWEWHRVNRPKWEAWWLALKGASGDEQSSAEGLAAHLAGLADSLAKAEPYRSGAELLRTAWTAGTAAAGIETEVGRRTQVADELGPLKSLGSLAESVARDAINELSGRIQTLLSEIHLSPQLRFLGARVQKREGISVRAGFVPELRVDATLVANTSWLRAVLWCFLFALREEAIEQEGRDALPLLAFDDPQSTFDSEHRHRWALYIASLQNGPAKVQLSLASYDTQFLELIGVDGLVGRSSLLTPAGPELGRVALFEGAALHRRWADTQKQPSAQGGREYIKAVREHVEGLLRLMLRGEHIGVASAVHGPVLGECKAKIEQLHNSGFAPWNRPEFDKLIHLLDKAKPAIKYLEMSHHSSGSTLGMPEAITVQEYWHSKLEGRVEGAFRLARDYRLLHGGLKAHHLEPPTAKLPDGYTATVKAVPMKELGRAQH